MIDRKQPDRSGACLQPVKRFAPGRLRSQGQRLCTFFSVPQAATTNGTYVPSRRAKNVEHQHGT